MSKTREQKRARRIQADTGWSYSECLRLVRDNITDEGLEVLKQVRSQNASPSGAPVVQSVILGLPTSRCDGIYPRTSDGQCMGCGTSSTSEQEHRDVHRKNNPPARASS